MKRANLFSGIIAATMFLFVSATSFAENAPISVQGETPTILGAYTITELEPETVGRETMRKFQLTYENGKAPVVIYLNERPRCREYIVRGHAMEVMYVCRKNGFGATTLNERFSLYPVDTNERFLSSDALRVQSKITSEQVSIDHALGLIACYYPELLRNINVLMSN